MKKLIMILMVLPLLLISSCNKEKAAKVSAAVVSLALTVPANKVLECKTGMYTNVYLNDVIYNILVKDKKKLKSAVSAGAQKSVATAAACRFGVNILFDSYEVLGTGDAILSEDMKEDGCSTKNMTDKGKNWFLSRCGS